MGKSIMLGLVILLCCSFTIPKNTNTTIEAAPTAFVIGQHPTTFETLNEQYSTLLLKAYEDDINKAFSTWKGLMSEIAIFATKNDVDMNGVKMWVKVFWSADGQIEHIAYNLKPESKNVDLPTLTDLLEKFVLTEECTLDAKESNFSHYGSISYPMQPIPVRPK